MVIVEGADAETGGFEIWWEEVATIAPSLNNDLLPRELDDLLQQPVIKDSKLWAERLWGSFHRTIQMAL